MIVTLLTEHHLEFLSLNGGCTGSSESTLVKCQIVGNLMPRLSNNFLLARCDIPAFNLFWKLSRLGVV